MDAVKVEEQLGNQSTSSDENLDSDDEPIMAPPADIQEAVEYRLPSKSKEKYIKSYDDFVQWKNEKEYESFSENIFLEYFSELSKKVKPTTLWVNYSMLNAMVLMKHNVQLKCYKNLRLMLKMQSIGYKGRKTYVLTRANVKKFLIEAPDNHYLDVKVALIFGIYGAMRSIELTNITMKDVENHDGVIIVKVNDSSSKINRNYVIRDEPAALVHKYMAVRPANLKTDRFFLCYRNMKCTKQAIGRHKMASMPKAIASYLNLPNPEGYTGHCFRRSSAAVLGETGYISLKKQRTNAHHVSESYIEVSVDNKINVTCEINESRDLGLSTSRNIEEYKATDHTTTTTFKESTELDRNQRQASPNNISPEAGSYTDDCSGYIHEEMCSECGKEIRGSRYVCVQCAVVSLCACCEARRAHQYHYVLRVPPNRPQNEVNRMVRQVRNDVCLFVLNNPQLEDEPEVKIEHEELPSDPLQADNVEQNNANDDSDQESSFESLAPPDSPQSEDSLSLTPRKRSKRRKLSQKSPMNKDFKKQRTEESEFHIFGKYVLAQLKKLSEEQAVVAQEKIQSIITHGRLADIRAKQRNSALPLQNPQSSMLTLYSEHAAIIRFVPNKD